MENINKKICSLDKIIEVQVTTSASVVKYDSPNSLQSSTFGMTISPNVEHSNQTNSVQCDLNYLANVIKKICDAKGFKTNFKEEFDQISTLLESDDFALNKNEKAYAELISDLSDDYPTYKKDKLEDAYILKQKQVQILLKTFSDLTRFIVDNGLNTDYTYKDSIESSYYDNSYRYTFVIEDCFTVCENSLRKCAEILFDNNKDVVYSSSATK